MPDHLRSMLLISPDLMLTSRVAGLAAAAGWNLEVRPAASTPPANERYDLAVLDLGGLRPPPAELIQQLRANLSTQHSIRIVAFGPHVQHERLQAAVDAGAVDAVSRGEFLGNFAACLARWDGSE
jgi:DNA-binding NarL/FixJ family response regulator